MKKVLFVCAENAGRSQMAEAFFNHYAQKKGLDWIAESAGTIPAKEIDQEVVETMQERDISLVGKKPKRFFPEKVNEYEKVVSFGCLVKSYFSPDIQGRIEEWYIDDPRGKPPVEIKGIRDKVEVKIQNLINIL